jgi:SAM-dependent methyltransferase
MSLTSRFLAYQTHLSTAFDHWLLPEHYRIDGNRYFLDVFAPRFLKPGTVVYDVGGGKHPFVSPSRKKELGLKIVGLDIDSKELAQAPSGSYDQVIVSDITRCTGHEDADLAICQALLEHVVDVEKAFAAIASILKQGGLALIFVPCRNALYARINLLLPERLKRKILFGLFPQSETIQGFRSYYNKCTPRDFRRLAALHGLDVEEELPFFMSGYFSFFLPAHILWRLWVLSFRSLARDQAAETFIMALRKR